MKCCRQYCFNFHKVTKETTSGCFKDHDILIRHLSFLFPKLNEYIYIYIYIWLMIFYPFDGYTLWALTNW
jgi:hypothetical protein